ncbi:hypothetical protein [Xenorhabdus bovienii]|uniref:hypothetical protein n=1 Tax=Xenorhabdus bovienii TaxID=40576 RepID=UPI0023B2BB41|nr:hypothetical protein [Xenorhabdus bovienii]
MKEPILASIKFDTSKLDKKIDELKSALPESILEHIGDIIASLSSNVFFADSSTTRSTLGTVEIVYFLDIDTRAYNEILVATRTFKTNLAHNDNSPLHGKSPEEILEFFKKYNFVDDHGHRLEMCQDFIDLINIITIKE